MMRWDEEFDIVCVGSGIGGLTTAVTAADAGARVLVVEKDIKAGGVTARSGGQLWAGGTDLENRAGIEDSIDEVIAYLEELSHGLADPVLRQVYAETAPEVVEYLCDDLGIPLQIIPELPDYYYPLLAGSKAAGRYLEVTPFDARQLGSWADLTMVSPYDDMFTYVTFAEILTSRAGRGPALDVLVKQRTTDDLRCAGAGLCGWLLKAAFDRGVEVRVGTPAEHLVVGNSGVEGIVIGGAKGPRSVRTGMGVMLATGGYDWNPGLVDRFESLVGVGSMAPVTVEGDHLSLAAAAGAEAVTVRPVSQTPIFVGYEVPGAELDGRPLYRCFSPGHPHSFIVNQAGRRFADDGFYPDVVSKLGACDSGGVPNWPSWLVFDQAFVDMYGLSPFRPGDALPTELATSAPTIRGLAAAAGIDADGLAGTVEAFNTYCADGLDKDFGRGSRPWTRTMIGNRLVEPNPNLATIADPPFYAVRLGRVAMGVPSAGLPTGPDGEVLDPRGETVNGLFAAGNAAAWRDIGGGYNSGIANTRGAVSGYRAARRMTAVGKNR